MDSHAATELLDRIVFASQCGRFHAAPPSDLVLAARALADAAFMPLLDDDGAAAHLVADAVDLLDDAVRLVRT